MTYEWQSNLGAYVATGWDEETPVRTLHIRGEVDGLDVVAVARGAFEDQEGIVYLIIDEGITSIGENAFGRCTGLRAVVLPEGLERIDEEAFAFCTGLTTVTIPSTVTDLYAHSFTGCTGVTDVYFLMTDAEQLNEFAWWDGTYATAGEEEHGGLSDDYTVYPLKLLDDPIATSLDEVPSPHGTAIDGDSRWYTIDGRCLGTDRPTAAGLYITRGRKVAVK